MKVLFNKFWKNFNSSKVPIVNAQLTDFLFSLDLAEIFIVPEISYQNHAIADDNFIEDLQDSIRAREKVLMEFEQSVLKIIQINKESEKSALNKTTKKEEAKPIFKEGIADVFYEVVKDYFKPDDQPLLKNLLTSETALNEPLIYKGNGNQLSDAFKQLFEANLIIGCNKVQLVNWILLHFNYVDKGSVRSYSEKYLHDIISSNTKSCQSPILNVRKKEGQFTIFPCTKKQ